jgi:dipeptide transport system substrate-binding protein
MPAAPGYYDGMSMPDIVEVGRGRRHDGRFTLNRPDATMLETWHGFRLGRSKEYADSARRQPAQAAEPEPVGTGRSSSSTIRKTPSFATDSTDYWRGKQKIDDLIFAITPDNGVATRSSRPVSAISCPIRIRPTSRR